MSSNRSREAGAPPRICVVISTLATPGGAERVASILANAWNDAGTPVTIVTMDPAEARPFFDLSPGLELRNLDVAGDSRRFWTGITRNLRQIARIRKTIREIAPDVVISFIDILSVTVVLASAGTAIPVIAADRTAPEYAPISRLWTLLRNFAYRFADRVVVQSVGAQRFFSRSLGARVAVIPNPVLPPAGVATRRTTHRVIAIGRFTTEKGFDVLIRSFAIAAAKYPEWTLTIYGDGPLRSELESLITSEHLTGRVLLPGRTRDSARELAEADVFVLSSRFEGFPNVLCEAMANGVASIATDCPHGPREIVHDGIDGILVPRDDVDALSGALVDLMASPGNRARLAANARRSVARFSVASVLDQWNVIIADVRRPR